MESLFTICDLILGATAIGNALTQYKKEHYYWCGVHIMCAVVAITLLIKLLCS